jgi:sarcosine/dimethylglycine N-methyltransferase
MKVGDSTVAITRDYYDSPDADNFYFHIWGGEDIHIGIYRDGERDIARASRQTVDRMMAQLPKLDYGTRVLDLGAGFGGAARALAGTTGCHVTALNLSQTENARNRSMSAAAGLAANIAVVEGSYEHIPAADQSFDVVWSQDALLHSNEKARIFGEVSRVLKPGGHFIFTDPMESGTGSRAELHPVLDRIHLESLGSIHGYAATAAAAGFETVSLLDLTGNLPFHYALVRDELSARQHALGDLVSPEFCSRMLIGLDHWVQAGNRGLLAWGILHFQKPL